MGEVKMTGGTTPDTREARTRWPFVDALRGFAIGGILFVNIPDLVELGYGLPSGSGGVSGSEPLDFLVQTRFVPIFTFLFGMSMFFVVHGARNRGRRAWLALLLRITVLFGIGLLHAFLYPGEVLREYAAVALLLLPFVLFLPRVVQLVVGAALLAAALWLAGGGLASTPGLMLLGAAASAYGLPALLESRSRAVVVTFAIATVLLIPALVWQSTIPGDPRFSTPGTLAGTVMSVWYVAGLSLLWRTPARRVIAGIFEPLGRMALTNYVGASVIVVAVNAVVDFSTVGTVLPVVILAAAILVAQSLLSRLWLRPFRYGPLEWMWRMATWREVVPLRRPATS